jgi:hypothetical protein
MLPCSLSGDDGKQDNGCVVQTINETINGVNVAWITNLHFWHSNSID